MKGNKFDVRRLSQVNGTDNAFLKIPKLYHLSNERYPELKSKAMLMDRRQTPNRFEHRVSLLLTEITKKDIDNYIRAGFSRWDLKPAYLYIINPFKIKNYDFAKMESTPEQKEYDDALFDDLSKNVSDADFKEWKMQYSKTRNLALDINHGIPPYGTIEDYLNHPAYDNWASHDWVDYNLEHGHKDQYATTIPHMQIHINEPIQYEEAIQLR